MNFLAFSVQGPEEDLEDGRAFSIADYEQPIKDGLAVDLTQYLKIDWSKKPPEDAFEAIQHRGKWFYIDDQDADSKRFFNAVYDLYNIEIAASAPNAGPMLTQPLK